MKVCMSACVGLCVCLYVWKVITDTCLFAGIRTCRLASVCVCVLNLDMVCNVHVATNTKNCCTSAGIHTCAHACVRAWVHNYIHTTFCTCMRTHAFRVSRWTACHRTARNEARTAPSQVVRQELFVPLSIQRGRDI